MRHNGFWAALLALSPLLVSAQQIPGRDLFEFPLGSLAEGRALALATGDGLRNPASIGLPTGVRARFSVSSLTSGTDEGVAGQILSVAVPVRNQVTAGVSVARAAVSGIGLTQDDPQSVGSDLPYSVFVLSALAARRSSPNVTTGVALRYQYGELDTEHRTALGVDAGVVVEHILTVDGRLGLSSFLWRPGTGSGDGAAFSGAFDARIAGRDSLAQLRAGYSYNDSPGLDREHYAFASARVGRWEARGGLARTLVAGHYTSRMRFAIDLHYARYLVGVARDESPAGLTAIYHFTFVTSVPSP